MLDNYNDYRLGKTFPSIKDTCERIQFINEILSSSVFSILLLIQCNLSLKDFIVHVLELWLSQ